MNPDTLLKLKYILTCGNDSNDSNDNNTDIDNYRAAMIKYYNRELKDSLDELCDRIDTIYDNIIRADSNNDFEQLYENTKKEIKCETDLLKTFAPSIVMWSQSRSQQYLDSSNGSNGNNN
jgi:hypothetical protein